MILLILGLLTILVLVYQIYKMNKNKEGFGQGNPEEGEIQAEKQTQYLTKQDKYYDVRSQGPGAGLLVTKPGGINDWMKFDANKNLKKYTPQVGLEQSEIDKKVTNCRALTKCGQLDNSNCGYCSTTKEFDFGDKNGPKTDVCPNSMWTTDASKCKELREKTICSEVKSCGDLYGDAEKICGYCPTTGTSMVMKKVGDKYFPKYSDDVCGGAGFGLIPGSKCKQFAKDHPCVTPYYLSGPHSGDCVRKLWKNSACTNPVTYGKTPDNLGKVIRMSYKDAGTIMKNTNNDTRSTDYWKAVTNSDICYGNHKNIKECDMKYSRFGIPHPKCLEKMFLDAGGERKGHGYYPFRWNPNGQGDDYRSWYYSRRHVARVNELARDSWNPFARIFGSTTTVDKYKKDLIKIMENIKMADTYRKRYDCSMFMTGRAPPPPKPIKKGDTVNMRLGRYRYEGVVMDIRGALSYIMWTKISGMGRVWRREDMSSEAQAWDLGWPGINPKGNSSLKTIMYTKKLNLQKSCSNNPQECKRVCKVIINDLNYKFPRPRDCVVSSWSGWSGCTKKCGTGKQTRTRRVLYPPKFGGKQCPTLTNTRVCNTKPCSDPSHTFNSGSGFYKNNTLQIVSGRNSWTPPRGTKLKECQGDCDSDRDCAPGLKCYERSGNEPVPGCTGKARRAYDYCIPKETFLKHVGVDPRRKLQKCEGDCDSDRDCAAGLKCYQRGAGTRNGSVPGCAGRPKSHWDYCVPKTNNNTYSDMGKQYCVNYTSYKRHHAGYGSWSYITKKCKQICNNDSSCNAIAVGGNRSFNCTTYNRCSKSGRSVWWTRRGPGNGQYKFYKKQ